MRLALAALTVATALPAHAAEPLPDDWRLARVSRDSMIALNANVTKLGMSGAALETMMIVPDDDRPIILFAYEADCIANKLRATASIKLRSWNDTAGVHNRTRTQWSKPDNDLETTVYNLACKGTTSDAWVTIGDNAAGLVTFYYEKFLGIPEPTTKAK
jgi:hypothetical protein